MKRLIILLASLTLAACATAPTVTTDSAPGTDFSKYHTYTWGEAPVAQNPIAGQRIVSDIDAQLQAKGWTQSPNGKVTLVGHVAMNQKQTLNTFYTGSSFGGWGWRGFGGMGMGGMGNAQTTVSTYDVGTLVLDMFDTQSKQAIWRGTASATVPGSSSSGNALIDEGITKMFAAFPPGTTPAK